MDHHFNQRSDVSGNRVSTFSWVGEEVQELYIKPVQAMAERFKIDLFSYFKLYFISWFYEFYKFYDEFLLSF